MIPDILTVDATCFIAVLQQAVDDCMFRILTIIDPENADAGPIIHLEHEVRSVIKRDGSKYKSCPFDSVPEGCVTLAL